MKNHRWNRARRFIGISGVRVGATRRSRVFLARRAPKFGCVVRIPGFAKCVDFIPLRQHLPTVIATLSIFYKTAASDPAVTSKQEYIFGDESWRVEEPHPTAVFWGAAECSTRSRPRLFQTSYQTYKTQHRNMPESSTTTQKVYAHVWRQCNS